jgi:DNA helicase-2/ATP-dependent DNA helicase PcrA
MQEIKNPDDNAYRTFPGPILLLAGPGTGKTHQLAMRSKYLIEELGAKPTEIAVITFTTEAARNMRERLSHKDINVPKESQPEIISTMHKIGNMIIGSRPERVGLSEDYSVLPSNIKDILLRDAANITGFELADAKKTGKCREQGNCQEDSDSDKCKICAEYKRILRKCSCVDYDDQIFLACELLHDSDLLNIWQSKTKYLLVDEYQDINQAQFELIQFLTKGQSEGLFVVGDDDQSIYSFRGGTPEYIKNFELLFGIETKIGRLSKSWRCPEHILKGAKAMVTKFYSDSMPKPDPIFSEEIKVNNKIFFYDVPQHNYEAWLIAKLAQERVKAGDEVVVIIPNSKYLPVLKQAFIKAQIDYRYKAKLNEKGLARFTAISEWVENPEDNLKLRYLTDLIIGSNDQLTMEMEASDKLITTKRKAASRLIASLWIDINKEHSMFSVISEKAKQSDGNGYLSKLWGCLNEIKCLMLKKGGSRIAISDFLGKSGVLVAPGENPNGLIAEVREWIHDLFESGNTNSYKPVNIYNRPSSKGLEGDIVFVVGLSERLFPYSDDNIEEESRLLFVAMTRAKKELHLFNARKRPASITFIADSYQFRRSSFIDAIPVEHIESTYINP